VEPILRAVKTDYKQTLIAGLYLETNIKGAEGERRWKKYEM
jgi:hypothetical protein